MWRWPGYARNSWGNEGSPAVRRQRRIGGSAGLVSRTQSPRGGGFLVASSGSAPLHRLVPLSPRHPSPVRRGASFFPVTPTISSTAYWRMKSLFWPWPTTAGNRNTGCIVCGRFRGRSRRRSRSSCHQSSSGEAFSCYEKMRARPINEPGRGIPRLSQASLNARPSVPPFEKGGTGGIPQHPESAFPGAHSWERPPPSRPHTTSRTSRASPSRGSRSFCLPSCR